MRLPLIEPEESDEQIKEVFKKLVMAPNVLCQLANSLPVLDTYVKHHANLENFKLSVRFQKMISLAVSQFNKCSYCIALHTATAVDGGILTKDECIEARRMYSSDSKAAALLNFTKAVLKTHGKVSDETLLIVKRHDFSDQEIVEMIAIVSYITLANYVANVGEPELDFLEPPPIN